MHDYILHFLERTLLEVNCPIWRTKKQNRELLQFVNARLAARCPSVSLQSNQSGFTVKMAVIQMAVIKRVVRMDAQYDRTNPLGTRLTEISPDNLVFKCIVYLYEMYIFM